MASVEDLLKDLRAQVDKLLPKAVDVTELDFEAHELVLVTKTPAAFAEDGNLIRKLARALQKRIAVRPDPSALLEADKAEKRIRHILPPDAGLTDLSWEPATGEVTLEVQRPGLAIGSQGST
ncbi:MAG TPA: beta-CASP ribonuclease aCPSF1, partial [Candidatus Thermoplasmatota archaeon]|nr:beta-CASP ribonuclease aCPSF1 [Candidatus Thermoplasmatota archaeon]